MFILPAIRSKSPLKNIEIKYRLNDPEGLRAFLASISGVEKQWERRQTDIYYRVFKGRLKLRLEDEAPGQLIFYRRTDASQARESDYQIYRTDDPAALHDILRAALQEQVTVVKRRTLYLFRNVRIHIDRVESLGDFLEFESVVSETVPEETARQNLEEIARRVRPFLGEPVPVSYSDLLLKKAT